MKSTYIFSNCQIVADRRSFSEAAREDGKLKHPYSSILNDEIGWRITITDNENGLVLNVWLKDRDFNEYFHFFK